MENLAKHPQLSEPTGTMKTLILCTILALATAHPIIEDKVYEDLSASANTTVILHFKGPEHSDLLAQYQRDHRPLERTVHQDVLPNMLEANANKHQSETLEFLRGRKLAKSSGSDFTQLWMVNQLVVHNADVALIEQFKKSKEITKVEADRTFPLIDASTTIYHSQDPNIQENYTIQWGVKDVGAPGVWNLRISGQGVTVGVIDTGIRATHEILRSRFRSTNGWFDAIAKKAIPYDDNGRGTHVAGTIAGINGYGVAPNATLIACKACNNKGCTMSSLLTCGQFMLCPTDAAGKNKDCTKAAKVVGNSWGGRINSTFFDKTIDAWTAANILIVFANGNYGPSCKTAAYPGSHAKVISVGAITMKNKTAGFSSRGPIGSIIKPDIVAPGEDVKSASHLCDSSYTTKSGTSMAAAHIAGIAAFYGVVKPTVKQAEMFDALKLMAKQVVSSGQVCGGISDSIYPNNAAGIGKAFVQSS